MKHRYRRMCLLICMMLSLLCLPVYADAGPKPSVVVTLTGMAGEECWGTLISRQSSTGPYSASRDPELPEDAKQGEKEAWEQFSQLGERSDGEFYFLNYVDDCSDGRFSWTYYPPSEFQLALWFPDTQTLLLSEEENRYAFDSYFTLSMKEIDLTAGEQTGLVMERSYPYVGEFLVFLGRVVLTVGVEVLIAVLFSIRRRRQLLIILIANVITQGLLNVGLNLYTYFCGELIGMQVLFMGPVYLLAELLIVWMEMKVYHRMLAGREEISRRKVTAYAWTANLISGLAGFVLSFHIIQLF